MLIPKWHFKKLVWLQLDSKRLNPFWILLVEGYGLFSSGAKWQKHLDSIAFKLALFTVPEIPQILIKKSGGFVLLIVARCSDGILASCEGLDLEWFVTAFESNIHSVESHEVLDGYGFLSIQIQHNDFSTNTHADDKVTALETLMLPRTCRQQFNNEGNNVELTAFKSNNSSISWVCSTV